MAETRAEVFIFVGSASGTFDADNGQKMSFANMYVISPMGEAREGYNPSGFKSDKLKCSDPSAYAGLVPGQEIELFFDSRSRVAVCKPTGKLFQFPKPQTN